MQITETKSEGLSREYTINLPAAEIEEKVTHKLMEIQRTAQLPGFRPGKVPVPVLRKRFGQAVLGEVLERAVGDSSQQALSEKGVRPAMQPEIEITSFEDGADLEYKMSVETLPEIELADLSSIKLERLTPEADGDAVDEALANIAKSHQTTEAISGNRKSKSGDIVVIDFVGSVDGTEFPGGKDEVYQLELGSGSFFPGFEDQLIGVNAGAETDINVTFPESYGAAELAGKDAVFKVTVKEIREATPAAIDDELAKKAGMENLDKLKDAIAEEQAREYTGVARMRVKRLLLDQLFESHDFEVPGRMVDQEFETILEQFQQQQKDGEAANDGKSEDENKDELREIAVRRVRLGLLVAEIGRQNEFQIGQDDVNRAIMEEARRYPGQEQQVMDFYKQNPQALENVTAPLYEEKVVDFILELADVTDKKVSVADFLKTLEADN
ncbi:MAG: trigger factor, partial [Rhodospirillaceae bacterium]